MKTAIPCPSLPCLMIIALTLAACGPSGDDSSPDACAQVGDCLAGDGCCPAGCDTMSDPDCAPVCGNGLIEPGETCEADCPQTCDDGNTCTRDRLVGDPARCVAACVSEPIEACLSGDGCCPVGCDGLHDDDCSATCGNGVLEPGETCEGLCPQSCDDGEACTRDVMTGSAATCNVACGHERIAWCSDADGCCPVGCSAVTDDDCAPICGNAVIEPGETCEPAVDGCPISPEACDDGDACTNDDLTGRAADCNSACEHSPVEFCSDGDGCCPDGCHALLDIDCEPVCGNEVIEPGETCDGNCPRIPDDCDEGDACTRANVFGDPDGCHSTCGAQFPILTCAHGDGCCPADCDWFSDDDCEPCPMGEHPCDQGCCAWEHQIVEQAQVSITTGLAFDAQDRPHLVYGVYGESFHYAKLLANSWQVLSGPPSVGECRHHVLQLDDDGSPHVAWWDQGDQTLRYATLEGEVWSAHAIQIGPQSILSTPIAMVLGPTGRPIIAYHDADGDRLQLTAQGDAWFTTTIDDTPSAGASVALARDAQGRLHVAYTVPSEYKVAYGINDGNGWEVDPIGVHAHDDARVAMALDLDGRARIAFHREDGLVLAHQGVQVWLADLVHPCQDCSLYGLDLTVDAQGESHLVFSDWDASRFIYARQVDGRWVQLEVADEVNGYSQPGLALDADGAPAIGLDRSSPARIELVRW